MNPIDFVIIVVAAALGIFGGIVFGRQQGRLHHEQEMSAMKEQAEARLLNMQEKQRLALLDARDETAKVRTSIETEARERRQEIKRQEQRLQQKEENLDRKVDNLERQERTLAQRNQELEERLAGVDALRDQRTADLQRVARMSVDEARVELISSIEESARREASIRAREIEMRAREEAESHAREIITLAVQVLCDAVPLLDDAEPLGVAAGVVELEGEGDLGGERRGAQDVLGQERQPAHLPDQQDGPAHPLDVHERGEHRRAVPVPVREPGVGPVGELAGGAGAAAHDGAPQG